MAASMVILQTPATGSQTLGEPENGGRGEAILRFHVGGVYRGVWCDVIPSWSSDVNAWLRG